MTQDQTGGVRTFAARHGLIRPVQGRHVAGVCAALARATKTDPVLWRVTLAVLICFAGVGAALYLLVWLVSPEEGDTASPIESLLGRGHSSTSPVVTVVLGLIFTGLLIFILPRPIYVVLGGAIVLAILLLVNRSRVAAAAATDAGTATPPPAPPTESPVPPAEPSTVPPPPAATPTPPFTPTSTPSGPSGPIGPVGPPLPPPGWTPPAGYRPPFAPHGPFAGPPVPPLPPRLPRPPRERSALPPLILFAGLVALAALGAADLSGLSVPVAGYVAVALAVVGAGLVVGAWLGRARPMIALGIVLALLLPTVHTVEVWDAPEYMGESFTWRPDGVAEIQDEYSLSFGEGELDLTGIDFTGQDVALAVDVSFGEMRVLVPPDVAVEADIDSRFSGTRVFGTTSDDVTQETVRDPGSGDPADGTLRLDLRNRFGNLVVSREVTPR